MDGLDDDLALRFLEVMKDLRILRISSFLATLIGVFPLLSEATIVHLWQDLDSFLKIICVKSVITGSKMKQRWRKAKQMQPM